MFDNVTPTLLRCLHENLGNSGCLSMTITFVSFPDMRRTCMSCKIFSIPYFYESLLRECKLVPYPWSAVAWVLTTEGVLHAGSSVQFHSNRTSNFSNVNQLPETRLGQHLETFWRSGVCIWQEGRPGFCMSEAMPCPAPIPPGCPPIAPWDGTNPDSNWWNFPSLTDQVCQSSLWLVEQPEVPPEGRVQKGATLRGPFVGALPSLGSHTGTLELVSIICGGVFFYLFGLSPSSPHSLYMEHFWVT